VSLTLGHLMNPVGSPSSEGIALFGVLQEKSSGREYRVCVSRRILIGQEKNRGSPHDSHRHEFSSFRSSDFRLAGSWG
jgi:hypothetical protein